MTSVPDATGYIYGLSCTCHPEDGVRYVGQTYRSIERRLFEHIWDATKRTGRSVIKTPLSHWIRKHGESNIESRALESGIALCDLDAREIFWIEELSTHKTTGGLNVSTGGESRRGWNHTPEAREKIIQALRGRPVSQETRDKIRDAQIGRPKPLTPEALASVRAKAAERVVSDETRKKISEKSRGGGNGCAKVTESDVLEIRRILKEGSMTQTEIASRFGIHQTTVSDIGRRKVWRHI